MDRHEEIAPDWKDSAAYAPLLHADRSILAWEWLRRDPRYRAAARAAAGAGGGSENCPRPEAWGLHAFEPSELGAPFARPVWRAQVHPRVLTASVEPAANSADSLDVSRLPAATKIIVDADREHVLISDGLWAIRLDIIGGTLLRGPVRPQFRIAGIDSAEGPVLVLRRLLALCRAGRFSATLHPGDTRAARLALMLRAYDAITAGASQREIAQALLSAEAVQARWRLNASSLRSRAQRLVRSAREMAGGGYRDLLKH